MEILNLITLKMNMATNAQNHLLHFNEIYLLTYGTNKSIK